MGLGLGLGLETQRCTHLSGRLLALFEYPLGMIQGRAACEHYEVRTPIPDVPIRGYAVGGLHATTSMQTRHDAGELPSDSLPLALVVS